jgi:hypothetical protein
MYRVREQTEWYWNGMQDGPLRRDVIVWRHETAWSVEQRTGDGTSTIITAADGNDARTIRRGFTATNNGWHDMTSHVEHV